jgi:hypothetical protein
LLSVFPEEAELQVIGGQRRKPYKWCTNETHHERVRLGESVQCKFGHSPELLWTLAEEYIGWGDSSSATWCIDMLLKHPEYQVWVLNYRWGATLNQQDLSMEIVNTAENSTTLNIR